MNLAQEAQAKAAQKQMKENADALKAALASAAVSHEQVILLYFTLV